MVMEFTGPMYMDRECIATTTSQPYPKWQALFMPFKRNTWILGAITFLACLTFVMGYKFTGKDKAEIGYSKVKEKL